MKDTEQPHINDTEAVDLIHGLLDGTEWDSCVTAMIAGVVKATGRKIREPFNMPHESADAIERARYK